jgi:hypothetical protein
MKISTQTLIFATSLGFMVGISSLYVWHTWHCPGRPLFVEIANMRTENIPLLKIEHGNDFSQERILLTQLKAGETRVITLNHEPGKGYSVEAQLADGKKVEACVGKMSESWTNRIIITSNGIFSKD